MKRYFWLNISIVFTLLLSLLSPAITLAEVTEKQTGVALTKAVQTDEGVSLLWETVSNEESISKEQESFLVIKNGQQEEIIPSLVSNDATDTKQVYTYLDPVKASTPTTEYSIVWNINGESFTSNVQTIVQEELATEESNGTSDDSNVTTEDDPTTAEEAVEDQEENDSQHEAKKDIQLQQALDASEEGFLGLDKSTVSENRFHISWYGYIDRSQGRITKYELYLDGQQVKSGGTRFTDHEFTNMNPETTYVVTVKAFNASNVLLLENSLEVKTLPNPSGAIVQFADANLAQAIKDNLGVTRDIYESDLENMTTLYAASYGIKNITGLEKAVNLTTLYLYFNEITDITPLANLTSLIDLDLDGNNISNVTALKNLTNLSTLWLAANPVSNIKVLGQLTNLEFLFLHDTKIKNIDVLLQLPHLRELTLSGSAIDLTEGSSAMQVLLSLKTAGVYIDILDGEVSEEYLELWAEGTSEESIFLFWWYFLNDEDSYFEEYQYKVYVNGKLYKKTKETDLLITGLKAETEYDILVEMYHPNGALLLEASMSATTLAMPSGDIITIPDAGLEAAIRQSLNLPKRKIYQSDMERLTMLDGAFMDIKKLNGLEYAVNIEWIELTGNYIKDLTPLKNLQYLDSLSIADNNITNIKPLKGMYLYNLDLSGNPIKDISVLETLIDLELLYLHNTSITDISVLLTLDYLMEVTLFGIEGLTFEVGTPELAVVEELLARGVYVYISEDDFFGVSPISFNVLDVTEDSIELDWTFDGDEEVAYYGVIFDYEWVDEVEDGYYLFTDLLADTSYDIAVVAFDEEDEFIGFAEITVSTLPLNKNKNNDKEKVKDKKNEVTPVVKPVDNKPSNDSTAKKTAGNKLPVTATNTTNYILVGLVLLILGAIGVYALRRRRTVSH